MPKTVSDFTIGEIQQIVQHKSAWRIVTGLLDKKYIYTYENLFEKYKPKYKTFITLHPNYENEEELKRLISELERAPKQLNIVLCYLHLKLSNPDVELSTLLSESKSSPVQINTLIKKLIFQTKKIPSDRIVYHETEILEKNKLSETQNKALSKIKIGFNNKQPVLLHGITGSGKTHLYFKVIEEVISEKKQVLYLLPEIALTSQIIKKLTRYFGNKIAVYHSKFNNQERVEIWNNVLKNKTQIIIGARSSIFLPFQNLGLIIVDEEHDNSYKQQDPAPRYHARDSAFILAKQFNANILLGSATPSIETYYNAIIQKFHLVELNNRFTNIALPDVVIKDIKNELLHKKMYGIFSEYLLEKIKITLERKKQIILFQNRRGYTPSTICNLCGWVPQCTYCDVSLSYHKQTQKLHCHYCGNKTELIETCKACGNTKLKGKNFGTEKIEEEIKSLFPHAVVQRFDWDILNSKNKHAEIINEFEKRKIDILVGTQMVVKGLDFEHVELVGVLHADNLLSFPDFRTNERLFQLLEQVSGRAGRKENKGLVIIQLFKTNHPIIENIKEHDYKSFYKNEIEERKDFYYPPFTHIIKISVKHTMENTCEKAAALLSEKLKTLEHCIIYGPAEPSIGKIKNKYIREIMIKIPKNSNIIKNTKSKIQENINALHNQKKFSTVQISVSVDPQ